VTSPNAGSLQLSQGYEVLAPRSGKAYPVPCEEWAFLKEKLSLVATPPWVLPAITFVLLGASLTTFISVLLGGVAPGPTGNGVIVAWAVCAASGVSGIACLLTSVRQHQLQGTQVRDVVRQMELIEKRFEQGAA
jgi:hypothetical protein